MADKIARISTQIGRFRTDRLVLAAVCLVAILVAAQQWLSSNPQHNPWAPLDLRNPPGWATHTKLSELRRDKALCRDVLSRSEIDFVALAAEGEGACARPDRTVLSRFPYSGRTPATTCPVAAGMQLWLDQTVQPAALEIFGSAVTQISHLGAFSCRRMYNSKTGAWSEHATGNAIDVAGFELANGIQISLLDDWNGDSQKSAFLRRVRDGGCGIFGTVLSPDYNAAHRDHFHFDQADRNWGVCR
ncbi:extensin family protein [Pontixanthobacter aestiaquae]|uniref:Extensin n=1 Tax=Pontixanthobacter aestiaquae TaxID=1509367 RepID=A0A844Z9C7_9SPHN|nr:extensin family protein [Pontixanthobacter aestiaquae]MDN3645552.1 extensin family protein [Pontixanthobacter aestiaquae]MXO83450.1 extensin [Pontixanthobacter aestiaquae]